MEQPCPDYENIMPIPMALKILLQAVEVGHIHNVYTPQDICYINAALNALQLRMGLDERMNMPVKVKKPDATQGS